ncbi:hypothetical protein [Rhizobium sp. RHZ01]|uniref:hypothetical protein n=1 Tax=Rhizobium sp. RHZ01 TaxID=2769304 RepID=UPI00178230B4|nr:hypothetical protein [Rhizobium sp. RHZ01]MBD9448134.1 hypothetical protein [Rhizobium sp. RHZ01]
MSRLCEEIDVKVKAPILRTVRAALREYRSATRVNGKRSWYALADALYDEFLELPDGDEDDADPRKALAKALRRFAAGDADADS